MLDLGCGDGGDALWLARRGWRVTAVDISPVAAERLAGRARAQGLGDLDGAFDDLDADTAPAADDFDDFAFGLARALDGVAAYLGE